MITDTHPLHAAMAEAVDIDAPVELRLTCGTLLIGFVDSVSYSALSLLTESSEAPIHIVLGAITTFQYHDA